MAAVWHVCRSQGAAGCHPAPRTLCKRSGSSFHKYIDPNNCLSAADAPIASQLQQLTTCVAAGALLGAGHAALRAQVRGPRGRGPRAGCRQRPRILRLLRRLHRRLGLRWIVCQRRYPASGDCPPAAAVGSSPIWPSCWHGTGPPAGRRGLAAAERRTEAAAAEWQAAACLLRHGARQGRTSQPHLADRRQACQQ